MRSFNSTTYSGDRQFESAARVYSRSPAGERPRPAETQSIFSHPVVSILRRIDEIKNRDQAAYSVKRQAAHSIAELEACLAVIQRDV